MTDVATWWNPPARHWTICSRLHDEFNGDWLLAIAAYNCGEINVERALEANRQQGQAA